MNAVIQYAWPELPPMSNIGDIVILRAPDRNTVRPALGQVLELWSGSTPERLPLHETATGPVWLGLLAGASLDLSITHSWNESWIALRRGGFVGIDAMVAQSFAEMADLARDHFPTLEFNGEPMAFAHLWTEWEARLKCMKRSLGEISLERLRASAVCDIRRFVQPDNVLLTVASL